jgi:hypothetical protein
MQKEIAMRTHTQLKVCFAAVLIALATLTIVTAPVQVMGAAQSKSPAIVALPQDGRESGQARDQALQGTDSAERVAANHSQKTTVNSSAKTPGSALSFMPAVPYYSGGYEAFSIAVADVNGDGKPDVLVVNYCIASTNCTNGLVGVLLGNGDGTFQATVTYSSGGFHAVSLVVADVNGDGKPDLIVANQCFSHANCVDGGVGVLLGNGDGTFQPPVTCNTALRSTSSVAVGDINGDGKPDLVETSDGIVGVLLGNGDGTFQPVTNLSVEGVAVAIVDVNGDAKDDLLVGNSVGVGVLLGNGDGTFQPEVIYSNGAGASSIAVADVNEDGKLDLATMDGESGNVSVLLGNGDGTFQPAVTYGGATGLGTPSVALADVNGDGKLDLVAVTFQIDSKGDGGIVVFLGNGDGTFQPAVVFGSGGYYAWSSAVADVNGDGKPDLVAANLQLTSGQALKGYVGVLINNTVFSTPTTTKLVSSPNPSLFGQAVTFTATVNSAAGPPPNGEIITFNHGSVALGTGSLSAGSASLTNSSLPVGTSTITATYPGDSAYSASTSPGLNQVVNPTGKFTTSTALASSLNPSTYGQKVTWTATVTSSGSVTPTGKVQFTWSGHTIGSATLNSSGVATLTKSNLNADTYPLTAVYVGDAANLGSTSAVLNQVVLQATSTATLTSSPNPSTQGQAVTFTAKISSATVTPTGPVTFTAGKAVLGTGQLSGGKATLTISSLAVGSTTVSATYNGDSNIAKSSASVTQTVH